jgi:hypothetical protein
VEEVLRVLCRNAAVLFAHGNFIYHKLKLGPESDITESRLLQNTVGSVRPRRDTQRLCSTLSHIKILQRIKPGSVL